MKKLLSVVLTMALLLCVVPLGAMSVSAANVSQLSYTISGDEVTITGCDLNALGNLYIPETIEGYPVTGIDAKAFENCDKLLKVVIPDSVTYVGSSAFDHCDNLTSVVVGNGITTISSHMFLDCANLTSVVIPDSVTAIQSAAFVRCYSLTSINLPNSVSFIGNSVFASCISLTSINIPMGVASIGSRMFENCYSLTSVVIPDSVTIIKGYAFSGCGGLTIHYGGSEADWNKISKGEGNDVLLNATMHFAKGGYVSVYSPDVTHSVMDTEKGNGLAFRFELSAKGVSATADAKADLTNATVNQLGTDCKLVAMGAVLTNDVLIGENEDYLTLDGVDDHTVINISAVYLQEVDEDGCAFATRIINIPTTHLERTIYARPYYTIEVDSEQVTVYGNIDSASCAEYM